MTTGAGPTAPVTGPGHDRAVWHDRVASADPLSFTDLRALVGGRDRLVVLAAHPDDESIGAGRLLSAWRRGGGHARAVLATAGEACVDHVGPRPAGLAGRRLLEWQRALAVVDVERGETYGLADGGLEQAEEALTVAVRGTVADAGAAGRLVLLAPHPGDPHPDHRAVGRAARRVGGEQGIPVWFFPVWMTFWSDPVVDLGGRLISVGVDPVDDRAWAEAVRCFESQLEPWAQGWGPVVPPEMLAHHDRQLLVLPDGDAEGDHP